MKKLQKTLFAHIGGSKTGSSAMQNFFELNIAELCASDINYAYAKTLKFDHEHIYGNGLELYNFFRAGSFSESGLDELLSGYLEDAASGICSSEYLQALNYDEWFSITSACKRIGIELHIIFYVRDVTSFFLSAYDQVIKRHGEYRDILEWATKWDWEHFDTLKVLSKIKKLTTVNVISYDANKTNLIDSFLTLLKVNIKVTSANKSRVVNRSLSDLERGYLLAINKEFSDKYCGDLTDLFVYENPSLETTLCAQSDLIADLSIRFQSKVDWVNKEFFEGQVVVSVEPRTTITKRKSYSSHKSTNKTRSPENILIMWAIEKLKSQKISAERTLLHALTMAINQRILGGENSFIVPAELPADFDLNLYLLLNPDILISDINPYDHYINHGISEGRKYRYDNSQAVALTDING